MRPSELQQLSSQFSGNHVLVVTLLTNNRHTVTVSVVFYSCSFHLHGPLMYSLILPLR